ncbi:DUF4232 domain-containing protein [Streptomyces mangrovisoli]|uniref:DUF4232 domain-containing protein n=1 Tax=Streptomyces mangrovisoli TaxID=1428628 RepID=A0A1J4NTG9_9ACTN|nr:DUF4232 domain-containing protein [Streptomyces mangrovisoli]OIJ65600.1 hypothetical protein WN71_023010 [Streptomyces mangrovisoli]
MRIQQLSVLAVVAAAGLSLTACQGSDGDSAGSGGSATPSSAAGSPSGSQGSGSASGSQDSGSPATASSGATGGGSGTGGQSGGGASAAAGACTTSRLAFSSAAGPAQGTLVVTLKNTGTAACTLKGFPGVDLQSKDGTVSAERSGAAPAAVRVVPGAATRFTLHYPPNTSGGSGETFTGLVVTPPNETHSRKLSVRINVPVTDGSGSAITVDPVGAGG